MLIVVVSLRDGVVAAGLLGAVRMVPTVLSGMLSGAGLGETSLLRRSLRTCIAADRAAALPRVPKLAAT